MWFVLFGWSAAPEPARDCLLLFFFGSSCTLTETAILCTYLCSGGGAGLLVSVLCWLISMSSAHAAISVILAPLRQRLAYGGTAVPSALERSVEWQERGL